MPSVSFHYCLFTRTAGSPPRVASSRAWPRARGEGQVAAAGGRRREKAGELDKEQEVKEKEEGEKSKKGDGEVEEKDVQEKMGAGASLMALMGAGVQASIIINFISCNLATKWGIFFHYLPKKEEICRQKERREARGRTADGGRKNIYGDGKRPDGGTGRRRRGKRMEVNRKSISIGRNTQTQLKENAEGDEENT